MKASKRLVMLKLKLRDIKLNLLQYLSMVAITMLAVTLFCGFAANTQTLVQRVQDFYDETSLTDLNTQFSYITPDDTSFFETLKSNADIADFEPRIYLDAKIGQASIKLFSGKNTISAPKLHSGEAGVLLDVVFASDEYRVGDNVNIEILGVSIITLKVTGLMYFSEATTHTSYPVYIDEDILIEKIKEATGQSLTPSMLYNQIIIKASNPLIAKEKINSHYAAIQATNLILVYDRNGIESVTALEGEVTTSNKMTLVFPIIFLLVSVLVILTTISALILRERINVGTLKALGLKNGEIAVHYALFGAGLCLVGGIIGAVIGPFIFPNVLNIKYDLVYTLPPAKIIFDPLLSIGAVAFVTVLALAIGIVICAKVTKERPSACMRPPEPKNNLLLKATTSKVIIKNKKRKGNLPLRMASRNIIIKPVRALMTVAGVMGCTALLVCAFGIGDTITNSVGLELDRQFNYDISTTYSATKADDFISYIEQQKQDGKVEQYETYKTFYMTLSHSDNIKNIKVFSLEKNSKLTTINPLDGALITSSIAQELGISVGDEVILAISPNTYTLKITGLIDNAITKGVFVSTDIFNSNHHILGMWLKTAYADELAPKLREINGTGFADTVEYRRELIKDAVSSIDMIKLTSIVFSVALCIVVLYNLSLLNIKERARSIATLKVLGFSNREVSLSLFYEIMLLVFFGTIAGLFLGFPLLYLVLSINKIELISFIYHIKPISYVYSACISLLTCAVINIIFSFVIKKIKMLESLKSVE